MRRAIELVASYWSISGDCYASGPSEVSPFALIERVEMARKVGFRGVGFVHADIMAVADRIGLESMRTILKDNDMKYVEVEILGDWFADGARRAASDLVRRDLLTAAEALAARHIKICGDIENEGRNAWPMEKMVAELKQLADEAADAGTRVALELMPFSNLRTIDQCIELITRAGKQNVGIMLDIWHIARGNIDFDQIRTIPKELISWVEIDDARPEVEGTLYNDTIHNRELPGEGALDIASFLRAVGDAGYDGPYGVEILSRKHRLLPLAEAAQRVFDTSMRQFETLT